MSKTKKVIIDENGITFASFANRNYSISNKLRKYSRKLTALLKCRGISKIVDSESFKSILNKENDQSSETISAKTTVNLNDQVISICSSLEELARLVDLYGVYATSKYEMKYYILSVFINEKRYYVPIEICHDKDIARDGKCLKEYKYSEFDILNKSDRRTVNNFIEIGLLHSDYLNSVVKINGCDSYVYTEVMMRYKAGDRTILNPLESPKEMM